MVLHEFSNQTKVPTWLTLAMGGSLALFASGCAAGGEAAGTLGSEVQDNPRSGKITCAAQHPEQWGKVNVEDGPASRYADALGTRTTNVREGKRGVAKCQRLVAPSEVGHLLVEVSGVQGVEKTCVVVAIDPPGEAPKGAAIGANEHVQAACPA